MMHATEVNYTPENDCVQERVMSKQVEIEWITTVEAAELSGYALSSISRLCRKKTINCQRIGTGRRSVWLVDKASLLAYMDSDKDVGGRPYKTD